MVPLLAFWTFFPSVKFTLFIVFLPARKSARENGNSTSPPKETFGKSLPQALILTAVAHEPNAVDVKGIRHPVRSASFLYSGPGEVAFQKPSPSPSPGTAGDVPARREQQALPPPPSSREGKMSWMKGLTARWQGTILSRKKKGHRNKSLSLQCSAVPFSSNQLCLQASKCLT